MDDNIEALKRQLEIHRRNLRELERRAASYGSLSVPLSLLNEIELEKEKIARLEEKIAGKGPSPSPPPPSDGRGCMAKAQSWWKSQSAPVQAAIIAALGGIIVAGCGLFSGVAQEIVRSFLIIPAPAPIVIATNTPTPTSTATAIPTSPSTPMPTPTPAFMGKVCQIESGSDTSTIFLRQAEFDKLGLPVGTKVTVTVRDTGKTFDNVTLGLDSGLAICMVRLPQSYRVALGVADDTKTPTPESRPSRQFVITQTLLPMNKGATNFKGKACQIESEQDTSTVFLRQPEYNDFGVPAGTTVNVTVLDTGKTVERVTLGLDSGIAICSVRLSKPLRMALGVDGDTAIEPERDRPDRQFSIHLP